MHAPGARRRRGRSAPRPAALGERALTSVRAVNSDWYWLVDAAPEPDALDRLLEALEDLGPLPEPVLLASKIVGPDGLPTALPVVDVRDPNVTAAAFERHLLPVRVARRGSLLVSRRTVERYGLPDNDIEWTARVLREGLGLLVPASVATGSAAPAGSAWLRLLLSDALAPGEKPWFAFRLLEDALGTSKPVA